MASKNYVLMLGLISLLSTASFAQTDTTRPAQTDTTQPAQTDTELPHSRLRLTLQLQRSRRKWTRRKMQFPEVGQIQ